MTPVWITLAAIAAMLIVAAAVRFPIWNPIYFFGTLFALQIGAGFVFAHRLGMDVPAEFSLPLLGAYLLTLGILLACSLRDRETVVANPDLRQQIGRTELTRGAVGALTLLLCAIAVHNTVVNLILIVKWENLPVVAYNLYRRSIAEATPGVVLPHDVNRPFSVPFFSVVADHLVNPAVVIYFALLYCPKRTSTRRVGLGSVPWWIHGVFGMVVLNAAIVHRRNPLLVGIATAILLLYLYRKLSMRTLFAGAVVLVVGTVAFGQWRRGTEAFRPAEKLELPPVAGNTMIYEPLVYVGSGIPNFLRYWSAAKPSAGGAFLLSSLFPGPVDRVLGLEVNRRTMLRRMFRSGFVIPGQTLRTPWFAVFFDFGWAGVYALAILFPTGVHWLYRRALVGPDRKKPSLALFTTAKIIYLFPFIYLLFQLPFWITVGAAVIVDWQLARSARRLGSGSVLGEDRVMTVLITLDNPERTGAPWMALQYARALRSAGHRVVAACGAPSEGTTSILPDLEEAGVDVRPLPAFTPRHAPGVLWRLRDLTRREDVDCIVGFQQRDRFFACVLAALTGTACVISAQNQHVFRGRSLARWLKQRAYRWALRSQADLVICASEVVEAEVRRTFGITPDRTVVLSNGIDVRAFPVCKADEVRDTRRALGVEDDTCLVLSVGRLDRQKGQDLLLQAFSPVARTNARVRLALVGAVGRSSSSSDGRRYEAQLHALAKDGGLNGQVDFLGWRDDVPRLLAAADLYVQPSRWEGWPVAVVEAMAAGRPVVASDCSGRPRGFVDGEHGWIVPTEDVPALRDALRQAVDTPRQELKGMGPRARELAERHYDIRALGKLFVERVEEVVA